MTYKVAQEIYSTIKQSELNELKNDLIKAAIKYAHGKCQHSCHLIYATSLSLFSIT